MITTQEREKQAYAKLLQFEMKQFSQERIRRTLGSPFGKAPPLKLYSYRDSEDPENRLRSLSPSALLPSTHSLYRDIDFQFQIPREDSRGFNPFERPLAVDYFFPSDMFLEEDLTTLQLPTAGFSKYVQVDGKAAWRTCTVLAYDPSTKQFRIAWQGGEKRVTRANLRFAFESEVQFDTMVRTMMEMRRNHEAFVRYLGRFEMTLVEKKPSELALAQEAGIFSLISMSMTSRQHKEVETEIRELHNRGVQKFAFDCQYFPEKAKLASRPWQQDLEKRNKWAEKYLGETQTREDWVSFQQARKLVQSALFDPARALHLEMQQIYMRITQLRFNDYYDYLSTLRSSGALTLSQLIYHFRETFTPQIAAIDSSIKDIRSALFRLMQTDKSADADLTFDHCFSVAQTILESNIQYAVSTSITRLRYFFADYYSVLPLEDECILLIRAIPKELKARRSGQSLVQVAAMNQGQCISVVRELIKVLSESLFAGSLARKKLHTAQPFISLNILSKITDTRLRSGKKPNYFKVIEGSEQRTKRRSKHYNQPSASTPLLSRATEATLLRSLMTQNAECSVPTEEEEMVEHGETVVKRLLSEEVFGWVSTGSDELSLVLTPDITKTDVDLRSLAKAPFKQLQRVMLFKRGITVKQHLRAQGTQEEFTGALKEVAAVLQFSMCGPVALLGLLRQFDYLLSPGFAALTNRFISAHVNDYEGLIAEIQTIYSHKELIERSIPRFLQFGLFEVDLTAFKAEASYNAGVLCEQLLLEVSQEYGGLLRELHTDFEEIMQVLGSTPNTVEELAYLQDYAQQGRAEQRFEGIWKELGKAEYLAGCLDKFHLPMTEEESLLWWKTRTWPLLLQREKTRLLKRMQKLSPKFQEEVHSQIKAIREALNQLKSAVAEFVQLNDLNQADTNYSKAADLMNTLEKLKQEVVLANSREGKLGFEETNFSELTQLSRTFGQFHTLWSLTSEWLTCYSNWMDRPLRLVDCSQVISKFKKGKTLLDQLDKDMQESVPAQVVLQELRTQIQSFEPTLPVLLALKEESLRDRHWRQIWSLLSKLQSERPDSERKDHQTLREMLQRGLRRHHDKLELIALEARSEYEVELVWTRIDKAVKSPTVTPLQASEGLVLIAGLESMRDTLQEYATNVSFLLKSNRHIAYFRDDIKSLGQMITAQQIMLDDIHDFQEILMDLHPAFQIPEVSSQLPRTALQLRELTSFYAHQINEMHEVRTSADPLLGSRSRRAVQVLRRGSEHTKSTERGLMSESG